MADSKQIATQKIKAKKEEFLKNGLDLGPAKSDVLEAGYGGWYQEFEKGNIYSHHAVGTYGVHGKILNVYLSRNANGVNPALKRREFGFPKTDVIRTPDERFRMVQFEWGRIIHVAGTGGVSLSGEIYKAWVNSSANNLPEGLGYPISSNEEVAGGEVAYFERGFMYYDVGKSKTPIVVQIDPPLLGNTAIVTPDKTELPIAISISSSDLKTLGGTKVIMNTVEGRFFLREVGSAERIPMLLKATPDRPAPPPSPNKPGDPEKKRNLYFNWTLGAKLKDRTLYDLVFKMANGGYYVFSPHAFYVKESWEDFGLIHATDIHVARRIDSFKAKLQEAKEKYKRTDLDEGIKHLNNWNDGFRDLIRYANFLHKKGVLDGIIATGDLVDYQFEDDDNRRGFGNFEFFKQLILGQVEYPDGGKKVEELKVPIFTTLGNHDYRPNAYKIFWELLVGDIIPTFHKFREYRDCNITANEARAIQDGRPPRKDPNGIIVDYGLPQMNASEGQKMIEIGEPNYYFQYFNKEKSYLVKLGKHRLVMLDSGPDTGLPTGPGDALMTHFGNTGEDKKTAASGGPNSLGFNLGHLHLTSDAQHEAKNDGLVIVGTHAPLLHTKGNEYPHYFRETEHPTADENEVANYLKRQVPILPGQSETLNNKRLVERVKVDYKDWPLTVTRYFKTGDHKNLLDNGVSRGDTEAFLHLCAGSNFKPKGASIRPVDLILCGHRHTMVEMRLKRDGSKKELQYFFDFYSESPSAYYSSYKYEHDFGGKERVYIGVRNGVKPNGKSKKTSYSFWGEVPVLVIPPYATPLNESKNPKQWWQEHRPLFIQGAPLGPADNNTRLDKEENKDKPDPSFEGCKLIVVRNDTIAKITQILRFELNKSTWKLPTGIAAPVGN